MIDWKFTIKNRLWKVSPFLRFLLSVLSRLVKQQAGALHDSASQHEWTQKHYTIKRQVLIAGCNFTKKQNFHLHSFLENDSRIAKAPFYLNTKMYVLCLKSECCNWRLGNNWTELTIYWDAWAINQKTLKLFSFSFYCVVLLYLTYLKNLSEQEARKLVNSYSRKWLIKKQ